MLTLAFGQMIFFTGFHLSDWTGGDDGLRGIPRLPAEFPGVSIPLDTPLSIAFVLFLPKGIWGTLLGRLQRRNGHGDEAAASVATQTPAALASSTEEQRPA